VGRLRDGGAVQRVVGQELASLQLRVLPGDIVDRAVDDRWLCHSCGTQLGSSELLCQGPRDERSEEDEKENVRTGALGHPGVRRPRRAAGCLFFGAWTVQFGERIRESESAERL